MTNWNTDSNGRHPRHLLPGAALPLTGSFQADPPQTLNSVRNAGRPSDKCAPRKPEHATSTILLAAPWTCTPLS